MDLYYQNGALHIEISDLLDGNDYLMYQTKIFRIIEDYGINTIIIEKNFYNSRLVRMIKQDILRNYQVLIK